MQVDLPLGSPLKMMLLQNTYLAHQVSTYHVIAETFHCVTIIVHLQQLHKRKTPLLEEALISKKREECSFVIASYSWTLEEEEKELKKLSITPGLCIS